MIENLHRTIRNLYANASYISGNSESDIVAKDSDGNEVTLDWTSINTKRTELQTDYDAKEYARNRKDEYPNIGDQLDMLWHAIDAGSLDSSCDFYTTIKQVKDDNPKPE